jgi:hypothetical protein
MKIQISIPKLDFHSFVAYLLIMIYFHSSDNILQLLVLTYVLKFYNKNNCWKAII